MSSSASLEFEASEPHAESVGGRASGAGEVWAGDAEKTDRPGRAAAAAAAGCPALTLCYGVTADVTGDALGRCLRASMGRRRGGQRAPGLEADRIRGATPKFSTSGTGPGRRSGRDRRSGLGRCADALSGARGQLNVPATALSPSAAGVLVDRVFHFLVSLALFTVPTLARC